MTEFLLDSLCPEHNLEFASETERCFPSQQFLTFKRFRQPHLQNDPPLRWICPVQENFSKIEKITGIGKQINRAFWLVGLNQRGRAESIRSFPIDNLWNYAFGVHSKAEDVPIIPITYDKIGQIILPQNLSYIQVMEDTSWIHFKGNVYSVHKPIVINETGLAIVYYGMEDTSGKLKATDGHLCLEMGGMRQYSVGGIPTEEEIAEANRALQADYKVRFYEELTILDDYGIRFTKDYKKLVKFPIDFHGTFSIPDSVEIIKEEAFAECAGLTSVVIPKSVTSIGKSAFANCVKLEEIIVEDNNPNYCSKDGVLFSKKKSTLIQYPGGKYGEYLIPNSVRGVGYRAFDGCKGLTSLGIPCSVTEIDISDFQNCDPKVLQVVESYKIELSERIKQQKEKEELVRRLEEQRAREEARRIAEEKERQRLIREREAQQQKLLQAQQLQELLQGSTLFFDTETTGVPKFYNAPVSDSNNWPRLVQLAWLMTDKEGNILKQKSVIIKPDGFSIPQDAASVHGITTERAQRDGLPLAEVLEDFATDLSFAERIVGHNIDFDQHIVGAELWRLGMDYNVLMNKPSTCTMKSSTDFCAIPSPNSYYGGYKWPSLQELYRKLFNREFVEAHDALADITATKECFFELKRRGII